MKQAHHGSGAHLIASIREGGISSYRLGGIGPEHAPSLGHFTDNLRNGQLDGEMHRDQHPADDGHRELALAGGMGSLRREDGLDILVGHSTAQGSPRTAWPDVRSVSISRIVSPIEVTPMAWVELDTRQYAIEVASPYLNGIGPRACLTNNGGVGTLIGYERSGWGSTTAVPAATTLSDGPAGGRTAGQRALSRAARRTGCITHRCYARGGSCPLLPLAHGLDPAGPPAQAAARLPGLAHRLLYKHCLV
jgi:hypothetical protein